MRKLVVDEGTIVEDFGSKADAICNQALAVGSPPRGFAPTIPIRIQNIGIAQGADAATQEGAGWDYAAECSYHQSVMNNIAESGKKKATEIQMKSAQQQQTTIQLLQSQQQMIQQLLFL